MLASLLLVAPTSVFAATDPLDNRYVRISNSATGVVTAHEFGFTVGNLATPIGSIGFQFCSNSPIIGDPCVPPAGLDASSVVLSSQQGETAFALSGLSTANYIILSRPASLPGGLPSQYVFSNITNPSADGSYYVRIQTYTSTDATGLDIESGGVVFALNQALNVTAEVPPYLRFCVSVTISGFDCSSANSYLIDLGEFSKSQARSASSEFVVATNASFGYSVILSGTTLTSGNNIIPALLPGGASVPGTSQFGINLRSNTNPSIGADPAGPGIGAVSAAYSAQNIFRFQTGDTIATSANSSDNQKFTISYLANIASSQPAGYYATTLTYICLANF
jgi:hypothetical protein